MKKRLVPFTPSCCNYPVAMISEDLPNYIKEMIVRSWSAESSGFGDHLYVDEVGHDETS